MTQKQDQLGKKIDALKAENESLRNDSWRVYQAKRAANLFLVKRDPSEEYRIQSARKAQADIYRNPYTANLGLSPL